MLNAGQKAKELLNYLEKLKTNNMKQVKLEEIMDYKKPVGWYCLGTKEKSKTAAFTTYKKPNAIKRFFMRTLLDFYWIKDKNK
jgi:hypothetical protein